MAMNYTTSDDITEPAWPSVLLDSTTPGKQLNRSSPVYLTQSLPHVSYQYVNNLHNIIPKFSTSSYNHAIQENDYITPPSTNYNNPLNGTATHHTIATGTINTSQYKLNAAELYTLIAPDITDRQHGNINDSNYTLITTPQSNHQNNSAVSSQSVDTTYRSVISNSINPIIPLTTTPTLPVSTNTSTTPQSDALSTLCKLLHQISDNSSDSLLQQLHALDNQTINEMIELLKHVLHKYDLNQSSNNINYHNNDTSPIQQHNNNHNLISALHNSSSSDPSHSPTGTLHSIDTLSTSSSSAINKKRANLTTLNKQSSFEDKRYRRRSHELSINERWTCSVPGCNKYYKITSSRSIKQHVDTCHHGKNNNDPIDNNNTINNLSITQDILNSIPNHTTNSQ